MIIKFVRKVDKFAVENLPNGWCSWTTKYKLLGFIPIFYTVGKGWSLFCPTGKVLKRAVKTDSTIYITEEEFKEEYNNKWALPLNVKIKKDE